MMTTLLKPGRVLRPGVLRPGLFRVLALALCCVLLLFMTVEVAHTHDGAATDGTHCQLCLAAHHVVGGTVQVFAPAVLQSFGGVTFGEPRPGARAVLVTAFIRPPPDVERTQVCRLAV